MITALLGLASPALAADCVLVKGATVYLPAGPEKGMSVRVRGERIAELGRDLAPGDCEVFDARGQHLAPGFVETGSHLGLVEVSMEVSTRDQSGRGPAYQVADGYNPRSSLIPIARTGGVTFAVSTPSGGGIAGQSAWVDLAGSSQAEAIQEPSVALHAGLGASAASSFYELRMVLDDARAFGRSPKSYDQNRTRPLSASRQDLMSLQPLLRKDIPLVLSVERASDIEAALRFADEQGLRLVLRGGSEAWILREELARRQVPVMVDPSVYRPGSFDQLHARPDNAALLAEAGVPLVIAASSAHNARLLRQQAGNAVREGLPHQEAMRAISQNAADAFGMEDHGRIRLGALANLVLWTGDPLELSSSVARVWVQGEAQPLETRQTRLRDRYRELPGTPMQALDP